MVPLIIALLFVTAQAQPSAEPDCGTAQHDPMDFLSAIGADSPASATSSATAPKASETTDVAAMEKAPVNAQPAQETAPQEDEGGSCVRRPV